MGSRIFCKHCRGEQRNYKKLCQRATRRSIPRRTGSALEGQQRMTLSGVVVLKKPPTRSVVIYLEGEFF